MNKNKTGFAISSPSSSKININILHKNVFIILEKILDNSEDIKS